MQRAPLQHPCHPERSERKRAEPRGPPRGERRHAASARNHLLRAVPRQRENGIPFAGMTTAARPSQRAKYRSQTALPRLCPIPASRIPFSSGSVGVCPHPSERNTVLTRRHPRPDCASGDSARARLCIWRQRAPVFSPLAVTGGTVCLPGCRRRHSTARRSPCAARAIRHTKNRAWSAHTRSLSPCGRRPYSSKSSSSKL